MCAVGHAVGQQLCLAAGGLLLLHHALGRGLSELPQFVGHVAATSHIVCMLVMADLAWLPEAQQILFCAGGGVC